MPRQINKLLIKLQNIECLFKVPPARSTPPPASRPRTAGTLGACPGYASCWPAGPPPRGWQAGCPSPPRLPRPRAGLRPPGLAWSGWGASLSCSWGRNTGAWRGRGPRCLGRSSGAAWRCSVCWAPSSPRAASCPPPSSFCPFPPWASSDAQQASPVSSISRKMKRDNIQFTFITFI